MGGLHVHVKKITMKLAVTLFLAAGCSLTPAATLYSTFGPGDSYGSFQDAVGDGHTFNQTWGAMWADPFQVSTGSQVTAYRVAVRGGTSNALFVLSLWSGIDEPTSFVEGNLTSPILSTSQQILTLSSPTSPTLHSGVLYWLVMEASDPVADTLYWYRNDLPGLFRKRALTGGPWSIGFQGSDAFEVQGRFLPQVDSPEPSTLLLFTGALAAFALRTRKIEL